MKPFHRTRFSGRAAGPIHAVERRHPRCPAPGLFLLHFLAVGAVAVSADRAGAQGVPLWPAEIDTIRITAARPLRDGKAVAGRGFVQIVPLGAAAPASADLGDLLQRGAGVGVRRMGGLGAAALASIRGSSPGQVAIRIDDIPISTAIDALPNLALLPVRLFETAEIVRGPGEGEGAGTIRLTTPRRLDAPLRVRLGGGSFGTTSISATGGLRRGPVSVFTAAGRLSSRGDYPYLDRSGTPFETGDDRTVERRNNAFRQEDFLIRATASASPAFHLDYTGHALRKSAGVPGTESMQTRRVRDRFTRSLHALSSAGERGGTGGRISAHIQQDRDRYRNPDGEVGLGRAELDSDLRARGAEASAFTRLPGVPSSARLSGNVIDERWTSRDLLSGTAAPPRSRTTRGIDAEWIVNAPGRAEISVRERFLWARSAEPIAARSPRAGIFLDAGSGIGVRGSWGRFVRLPSFVEMFGQGGVQIGNEGLVPESGESWDAGATFRGEGSHARFYGELVAFGSRTRDAIVWIQNGQRTSKPENLERTRVRGIEAIARAALRLRPGLPGLEIAATATLQDPRDDGPTAGYHGKRLPYMPGRRASVEYRLDAGRFALRHSVDLESSLYRDRYNSPEKLRPARTLHDIEGIWRPVPGRLEASIAVRNLTNAQAQDVEGFPLPGRSAYAQLTWSAR